MSQNRGKQRQLEKQEHERDLAREKAQASSEAVPRSVAALIRLAGTRPFGTP